MMFVFMWDEFCAGAGKRARRLDAWHALAQCKPEKMPKEWKNQP
jgi:hypothetical protein